MFTEFSFSVGDFLRWELQQHKRGRCGHDIQDGLPGLCSAHGRATSGSFEDQMDFSVFTGNTKGMSTPRACIRAGGWGKLKFWPDFHHPWSGSGQYLLTRGRPHAKSAWIRVSENVGQMRVDFRWHLDSVESHSDMWLSFQLSFNPDYIKDTVSVWCLIFNIVLICSFKNKGRAGLNAGL